MTNGVRGSVFAPRRFQPLSGSRPGNPDRFARLVDDAAKALSARGAIYCQGDGGGPTVIPADDVRLGEFKNGAKLLIGTHGRVYQGLSMRRNDIMEALVVLERARGTQRVFPDPSL